MCFGVSSDTDGTVGTTGVVQEKKKEKKPFDGSQSCSEAALISL